MYQPSFGDTSATACGSFDWYEHTNLSASGNYTHVFENGNAHGCDSTVTLHLTVYQPTFGDTSATACGSFDWYEHTNLSASGNYTHVFENGNTHGCDSTVTLHLTVYQPSFGDTSATACGSFDWYEHTNLSASGNYTHVFENGNAHGCDSTVTLQLSIFENTISELTITTPDSCYTWNNIDYCTSGDYTQTFLTVHGCDSVVTLHLTITVGIYDHNPNEVLLVYPNPTSDIVNVQFSNHHSPITEIHFYDIYGKFLQSIPVKEGNTQIDLSRYAKGVYFVKALADGKTIAVRKVVKH